MNIGIKIQPSRLERHLSGFLCTYTLYMQYLYHNLAQNPDIRRCIRINRDRLGFCSENQNILGTVHLILLYIEEGFIQKRRQRSSLLLGTEFFKFLAALAILHQDDIKNRLICTRPGANQPILQRPCFSSV